MNDSQIVRGRVNLIVIVPMEAWGLFAAKMEFIPGNWQIKVLMDDLLP